MGIGLEIKLRRVRLGMKQNELARRAQVHVTRLSEYEGDLRRIPPERLERINSVLDEAEAEPVQAAK